MGNIINLLPDFLANQIAAGEVIQRPASVVKELLENALDAGATEINLILKDSGKTLIRVVDNGKGMTEFDARLCFERHATSKITSSEDLFQINSFGFRGEALASIAAIAHVELKTKERSEELGTHILVEGSEIKKQEPCQTSTGSSFAVRNLFFNVPARRKFLKSDPVELKHILEEFARIALPNHNVFFSVHHNDNEVYHFPPTNLRQRLANYFGKNANEKIVPVSEETDFIQIGGFIGRPEMFKKTRGDQYIFVNQRFIKSNYLNHAVKTAYENLIPSNHYPFYVLVLEIDPGMIDVNIHPTKQEIKFENERLIYNLVRVAVKHALGKYSIAPTIDFEAVNYQATTSQRFPSSGDIGNSGSAKPFSATKKEKEDWINFYRDIQEVSAEGDIPNQRIIVQSNWDQASSEKDNVGLYENQNSFQIHKSYIISSIKSGVIVIDQQSAHERILYENFLTLLNEQTMVAQQSLFPETIQLPADSAVILEQILEELSYLGFAIEKFGKHTFIINAVPVRGLDIEASAFIENFVKSYAMNVKPEMDINENIARSMAEQSCIKRGRDLQPEEMKELIDKLFACRMPYNTPSGKRCFITFGLDELQNRFKSK